MKTSIKYILVISLFIFSVISMAYISENRASNTGNVKTVNEFSFTVEGVFKGENTKQIILSYLNHNLEPVSDTLAIDENGKFRAKGQILKATSAVIRGNIESISVEDPNYVFIFLETGNNEIFLEENNFKNIRFKNNRSFRLYSELEKEIKKIYQNNKWEDLIKMRNSYYGDHLVFPKNKTIKDSLDLLESKVDEVVFERNERKKQFISDNPDEYLSAFILQMEFRSNRISLKEVNELFNNFTQKVKLSSHGQLIKEMFIQIENSAIGTKAKDFETADYLGKSLQLSDFKGNYVLLDFWAGWCKPCKKNHPAMKKIYNQYHDSGLEIIGVSFDRNEQEWQESIAAENLGLWHQVLGDYRDPDENAIHNKFNVMPIPAYILIDDKGFIIGRYLGADRYKPKGEERNGLPELEQKLNQIFSKS